MAARALLCDPRVARPPPPQNGLNPPRHPLETISRMRAAVVALGDLGRSARMQYHAHALVSNGVDVDLVGLEGTPLSRRVTSEPRITVHRIKGTRLRIRRSLYGSSYAVAGFFDAARLGLRLWLTLRRLPRPDLVLVQNPPAFPTVAVTWWSLRRRGVRFFI